MANNLFMSNAEEVEDLGKITKVHFKATLRIEINEPLWFCETKYVFPNQCGVDCP